MNLLPLNIANNFCRAFIYVLVITVLFTASTSCSQATPAAALTFEILETQPHDQTLFTQGLELDGDWLVESSGLYGQSLIRRYHKDSGALRWQKKLPAAVFAEGLTILNQTLYVITWQENTLFKFDLSSLETTEKLHYEGEGWGLANDGRMLFMSNGSNTITARDASTFKVIKRLKVSDSTRTYSQLNELEYAQGSLWANIWQSPYILRINPKSGKVTGILDLSKISALHTAKSSQAVLNGIAFDANMEAFWVTGKLWPKRYLIKIHE